ncbi:fungal-specific transcription factor domain-containing protein [Fusarium oxysporum Fo47]|uniref:fungal-specific transcription factor domain-containing protein n=1 Tax=Fusarium oxysporum Fo47 TaxID=660027 RepID=UPI002869A3F8|nr:fungal-specific transcription factor domain-containing protein [Fusarium oxysporum Fo47]QKD61332.2 fungal-specific transcription factor domain-domain-containing protein [Fusarium oxysporum Fo47]
MPGRGAAMTRHDQPYPVSSKPSAPPSLHFSFSSSRSIIDRNLPTHVLNIYDGVPLPNQAFGVCKAPLQELTTQNMNPAIVSSAKRGPSSDRQYDEHAKKSKISQANPEVDSINLSSILLLPSPGIQIGSSSSATISEDKPHAGLQAMPVLEQKVLEESVLNAFEYSDNVIVLGEKIFPVPIGSEINSFLKFKRAHPNSGGRAHALTYPQRTIPTCWNVAVQKPSDRTLLAFYCPGIRSAILCLAAVHLHDHTPDKENGDRVIHNYAFGYRAIQLHKRTVAYLRDLLNCKQDGSPIEILSLLIILSTIDALRIEHQTKAPFEPAWYQGLRLAEKYLDNMGQKPAFLEEECWNQKIPKRIRDTLPFNFRESPPTSPQHPQPTSLHISQAVLVARGIILTQASSEDVWTIHGGCGTSPKLLHIMSQINYCATRFHQDNRSIVVPLTAKKLLQLLYELKSTESAESSIDSTTKVIEQTAYAWLLTAIIYLRCRVQRYPPSHRYVRRHLAALAKCIQAVPASGLFFTANAPILPVFILGLLSVKNRGVAQDWFETVLQVPVRSTVPPIYEALKRTWEWKQIWPSAKNLPRLIQEREPWWEKLVDRLLIETGGMLCFM